MRDRIKAFFSSKLPANIVFYVSFIISFYTLGFKDDISFIIAILIPFILGFTTLLLTNYIIHNSKLPVFLPPPPVVRPPPNIYEESYFILVERVKEIEKEILIHKLNGDKVSQLQNELKEIKEELAFCSAVMRTGE